MSRCLLLSLLLTGCASPGGKSPPPVRASAGADRYWTEQRAQQPEPEPDFEWLALRQPERTQAGIIYLPTFEQIRIPHTP